MARRKEGCGAPSSTLDANKRDTQAEHEHERLEPRGQRSHRVLQHTGAPQGGRSEPSLESALLSFSPDGERLALLVYEGIALLDLAAPPLQRRTLIAQHDTEGLVWSPDSKRLVPRSRSLVRFDQTSGPAARAAAPART